MVGTSIFKQFLNSKIDLNSLSFVDEMKRYIDTKLSSNPTPYICSNLWSKPLHEKKNTQSFDPMVILRHSAHLSVFDWIAKHLGSVSCRIDAASCSHPLLLLHR